MTTDRGARFLKLIEIKNKLEKLRMSQSNTDLIRGVEFNELIDIIVEIMGVIE